jgi:hypothetical protein
MQNGSLWKVSTYPRAVSHEVRRTADGKFYVAAPIDRDNFSTSVQSSSICRLRFFATSRTRIPNQDVNIAIYTQVMRHTILPGGAVALILPSLSYAPPSALTKLQTFLWFLAIPAIQEASSCLRENLLYTTTLLFFTTSVYSPLSPAPASTTDSSRPHTQSTDAHPDRPSDSPKPQVYSSP